MSGVCLASPAERACSVGLSSSKVSPCMISFTDQAGTEWLVIMDLAAIHRVLGTGLFDNAASIPEQLVSSGKHFMVGMAAILRPDIDARNLSAIQFSDIFRDEEIRLKAFRAVWAAFEQEQELQDRRPADGDRATSISDSKV